MAKDPAMLWYWSDWNSGTILLSRFLKGCYIDLLHAQFNNGPLSLEEIKTCLGSDFGTSWPTLQKKFKHDSKGLFFNERLEQEKEKRKAFSQSRRNNISKRYKNPTSVDTSVVHMNHHMENKNENKNDIKKNVDKIFRIEECLTVAMNDPRWVRVNEVTRSDLEKFNGVLEKRGIYEKSPADYKNHYSNYKATGKFDYTPLPKKSQVNLSSAVAQIEQQQKNKPNGINESK